MIQPNELRIGNYVKLMLNHEDFNIIQIELPDMNLIVNHRQNGNEYDPIELTEEWLIKLGFEFYGRVVTNEYESYRRYVLYNAVGGTSNYELHIINSCYGGNEHLEVCYSIDNDERQRVHNTKYIHSLQNHFFTVTGQELTIKE